MGEVTGGGKGGVKPRGRGISALAHRSIGSRHMLQQTRWEQSRGAGCGHGWNLSRLSRVERPYVRRRFFYLFLYVCFNVGRRSWCCNRELFFFPQKTWDVGLLQCWELLQSSLWLEGRDRGGRGHGSARRVFFGGGVEELEASHSSWGHLISLL